jgi:hypothetical protein
MRCVRWHLRTFSMYKRRAWLIVFVIGSFSHGCGYVILTKVAVIKCLPVAFSFHFRTASREVWFVYLAFGSTSRGYHQSSVISHHWSLLRHGNGRLQLILLVACIRNFPRILLYRINETSFAAPRYSILLPDCVVLWKNLLTDKLSLHRRMCADWFRSETMNVRASLSAVFCVHVDHIIASSSNKTVTAFVLVKDLKL